MGKEGKNKLHQSAKNCPNNDFLQHFLSVLVYNLGSKMIIYGSSASTFHFRCSYLMSYLLLNSFSQNFLVFSQKMSRKCRENRAKIKIPELGGMGIIRGFWPEYSPLFRFGKILIYELIRLVIELE